ncbi:galaxin-like [Hydractinia symbiolongicarpus]|uniref:galaxin-like n=1 Tax=Hydractinia symbiolongicarpus TaxID=13093 RepID=UPI00254FD80D|nr:galaxin-like [Hydractinia symbiolongicarpus]
MGFSKGGVMGGLANLVPSPQLYTMKKMYQRGESICCGGQVFDQKAYGCCVNVHYLLRTQFCCDRKVIEKKSNLTTSKCCGDKEKTLYDEETDICCNGKVYQKHYGSRTRCCAKKIYDAKQNGCCNGKSPGLICYDFGNDDY